MKKLFLILLGLLVITPALMAASVSDINRDAWLSHLSEMGDLRRQIVNTLHKENRTAADEEALTELTAKFEKKQLAWDEYLKAVANDDEAGKAKIENSFGKNRKFNKADKRYCKADKALKCDKAEKECHKAGKALKCDKTEKKCCKADKTVKCDKAEKECHKADKALKCDKTEKKCCKADKTVK